MGKINVLVVPSDTYGVGSFRSVNPHTYLDNLYGDEFEVEIDYSPNWMDLHRFDKYHIIHVHKGLFNQMEVFWNAIDYFKENNIVTILDIDDNWEVGPNHPLYAQNKSMHITEKIIESLKRADYVTTTTEIFAEKIKKYNKNVFVFQNSIDPENPQYSPEKEPCDRIRFGFLMGSSHEKDLEQFQGMVTKLPKDVLDKIQIVLCGYDLRGTMTIMNPDGSIQGRRPIKPTESVWYTYEKILTNNYSICSPEYKDFLLKFLRNVQWPEVNNEPYRREWTKPVSNYGELYRHIDVLFAPLDCNNFNEVKSELKFIEGGFTRTAVIATNFGPYKIGSKSIFKKGGEIDPEGNCVLIEPEKKHKAWEQAVKKIVEHPEYIKMMTDNMYETVKEKYDIRNVTKIRADWYKSIVKK
jgi:glycosyltransferase involved in cell wall biosynthesis